MKNYVEYLFKKPNKKTNLGNHVVTPDNDEDKNVVTNYNVEELDDDEVLRLSWQMREDWRDAGWGENIKFGRYARDFVFKPGAQWDEPNTGNEAQPGVQDNRDARSDRTGRGKSCLEMNHLRAVYREMDSEQKLNAPTAEIIPTTTSKMPTEMQQTVQGRWRYDCYKSDWDNVTAVASQNQRNIGYGAFYLTIEKEEKISFNNVLRFYPIQDATYAFFDPTSQRTGKTDGCGAGYWAVTSYQALKSLYSDVDFTDDIGQSVDDLSVGRGQVAYCTLFVRSPDTMRIYKLRGEDEVIGDEEWNKRKKAIDKYNKKHKEAYDLEIERAKKASLPEEYWPTFQELEYPEIERQEEIPSSKIWRIVHTRRHVLKRQLLDIKEFLPMYYVCGDSAWIGGKEMTMPLCQEAIPIQKNINYAYSEIIDQINKSFGNIIVAHNEAIGNKTQTWDRPTIGNLMTVQTIQSSPQIDPYPRVISSNAVDRGLMDFLQMNINALYNVLGRSLENHGAQTNAESGKAILERKSSGELAVGVYPENLNEVLGVACQSWMEWAPYVYDTERELTILDKEGQAKNVMINSMDGENVNERGELLSSNAFAFKVADFSVECKGGASFAAQVKAAADALMRIMMLNPEALPPIMLTDLIEILPFPFKNKLVRQLKASGYMNPAVLALEEGKPKPPPEPTPREQIEQTKLKNEQMQLQANIRQAEIDEKSDAMELLGKALELEGTLSKNLADEAKAYASMPAPEIADAIELSSNILDETQEGIEDVTEQYMSPEEMTIVQKALENLLTK